METSKVGKRGAIVVPARLRRKFGIEEGGLVVAEERSDGILIRPAVAIPVEIYAPERKAEFLLSNTIDADVADHPGRWRSDAVVLELHAAFLNPSLEGRLGRRRGPERGPALS